MVEERHHEDTAEMANHRDAPPPSVTRIKVLVTGATGLLGRAVYSQLCSDLEQFDVIGTGWTRASGKIHKVIVDDKKTGYRGILTVFQLDLLDFEVVRQFVQFHQPQVILHCAAERRPDVAQLDPEAALKLNVDCVRVLAAEARRLNALFLLWSTDYVFDGTNPPYRESSAPNPLNFYGKSKYEGEKVAREVYPNTVILRVPLLYGDVETLEESAVTVLIKGVLTGSPMDNVAIRFPTHTKDAAEKCSYFLILWNDDRDKVSGKTFHFTSTTPYTKYQMALEIADLMKIPREQVVAQNEIDQSATTRPHNAHLSMEAMRELLIPVQCHGTFRDYIWQIIDRFYPAAN